MVFRGKYAMLSKSNTNLAVARKLVFLALILQTIQVPTAQASELARVMPSSSVETCQSQSHHDETQSAHEGGTSSIQLSGGVSVLQPHSLIGRWNGNIQRFRRHPKLHITHCQDGQIAGTYKGILGTFPLTGHYDEATGNISIYVNFSSSKLARLKRLRSGRGIIEANIQNGLLVGQASIPDLGPKTVRWEAVKDTKEIIENAKKAE